MFYVHIARVNFDALKKTGGTFAWPKLHTSRKEAEKETKNAVATHGVPGYIVEVNPIALVERQSPPISITSISESDI